MKRAIIWGLGAYAMAFLALNSYADISTPPTTTNTMPATTSTPPTTTGVATAKTQVTPKNTTFLFIQIAKKVTITKDPSNEKQFILTLSGVEPYVIYFMDHPFRKTGMLRMTYFNQIWLKGSDSFATNPPRAGLVSANFEGEGQDGVRTNVLILSKPIYNMALNQLTYVVSSGDPSIQLQTGSWSDGAIVIDSNALGQFCTVCLK